MSDTETIARENAYKIEKDNQYLADMYYRDILIPKIESKHPHLKVIGMHRFECNGKKGQEADYDTRSQYEGKDGFFILHSKLTGELTKIYFQEKFSTIPIYKTNKYCYESFEIVDNYQYTGWGCHLNEVDYLIFFHPDSIVVMENIQGLIKLCNDLYTKWKKTSLYVPQTLTVPQIGGQKVYVSKKDDPNDSNKWKITTSMSNWVWNTVGIKYKIESFGLDKYKEYATNR